MPRGPGCNGCGFCAEKWEQPQSRPQRKFGANTGMLEALGEGASERTFERGWNGWNMCKEPWKAAPTLLLALHVWALRVCATVLGHISKQGAQPPSSYPHLGVNLGSQTWHVHDQSLKLPSQTYFIPSSMNQYHHWLLLSLKCPLVILLTQLANPLDSIPMWSRITFISTPMAVTSIQGICGLLWHF